MPKSKDGQTDGKRKRRGRGEGGVFQRADGIWTATLELGRRADGTRNRRTVYGRTKTETTRKLNELKLELAKGVNVEPNKTTVSDYLTRWLEEMKPSVKLKTYQGYELHIRRHITPVIGQVILNKLQPLQIQELYRDRLAAGLTARTVHHTHRVLHTAMAQAVRWQLILRNPCEAVEPPKPAPTTQRFLGFDQAKALMAALEDDPEYGPAILLAMTTGLRLGEIRGLRWSDIDWDARTIVVTQTVWIPKGGPRFEERPKSGKVRRVAFPAAVAQALRELRKRQAELQRAAGPHWKNYGLAFTRPDGAPLRHDTVLDRLRSALQRAGLPPIRTHDLRHSAASLLIALGVPLKEVSEILGHSTIAITANLYGHLLPGAEQRAADKLGDVLFAKPKKARG